jgi:acyl-CoA hydrolase
MTVAVDAISEELTTGKRRLALRGSFEMVAVNGTGNPVPVLPWPSIPTPEEIPS